MYKCIKKLHYPSISSLYVSAAGGGGSGGFVYQASPALNADDTNNNTSFRVRVPISINSLTQIRATLRPGSTNSLSILHASIGKWDGDTNYCNTTAAPIELKFSGASGFTSKTTPQTSDWANLSGLSLTTSDKVIVIYDVAATGLSTASQRYNNASTGVLTMYQIGVQSWDIPNTFTPSNLGFNGLTDINYCLDSIETQ